MRRNWFRSVGAALAVLTMMAAIGPALAQVIPNSATYPNGTKVDTQPTYTINPNNGSPCLVGNTGCPVPGGGGGGGSAPVGYANMATTQVSVGTTATLVLSARTGAAGTGRGLFAITQQTSNSDIYCGATSGVTGATNGQLVPGTKGASWVWPSTSALYCIATTTPVAVSVTEAY